MTLVRTTFAALFAGLLLACEATKPLVPYNVAATSGDAQTDTVARALPVPLVVTVLGEGGNPASDVPVMWTVQSGGGSVGATTVTDAAGQASTTWTLGPIAGAQTVLAGAGGGSVTFTATASVPVLGATLTFTSTALREAVLVATVPIPANYGIPDTFVRDGIAFVFAWNSGVMIYDVGNGINGGSPNSPKPISTLVNNA